MSTTPVGGGRSVLDLEHEDRVANRHAVVLERRRVAGAEGRDEALAGPRPCPLTDGEHVRGGNLCQLLFDGEPMGPQLDGVVAIGKNDKIA